MKNSILFLRSIFFVTLIAGSAHMITYAAKNTYHLEDKPTKEKPIEESIEQKRKDLNTQANPRSSETPSLIGLWKVKYEDDDFTGAIVYEIKKEAGVWNGYTVQYEDEYGNKQKAKNDKTLVIKSLKNNKGKGTYILTYKGKKYDVACTITILHQNTFELSYDYYGYSDIEIWKKQ